MLRQITLNRTDYWRSEARGLRTSRGQVASQYQAGIRQLGQLGQLGQLRCLGCGCDRADDGTCKGVDSSQQYEQYEQYEMDDGYDFIQPVITV